MGKGLESVCGPEMSRGEGSGKNRNSGLLLPARVARPGSGKGGATNLWDPNTGK